MNEMYCVYCGVKLQEGMAECPLCHTPVMLPDRNENERRALYPDRLPEEERHSRTLLVLLLTMVMLGVAIACLILCLHKHQEVGWSGYVMMSLAMAWVWTLLPLLFPRFRPMIFLPIDFACLAVFLLYICVKNEGNWFLSFAFPVTGITAVLTLLGVSIFRYIRQGRLRLLGLYLIVIGASFMLIEFFQHISFGTRVFDWSLYCVVVFGVIGLFLFVATLIPQLHAHLRKTFFF